MKINRAQRRARKRDAAATAARLVARCYDFGPSGGLVPIESPHARAALCRASEALLRGGGAPVAIAVTQTEAKGFPATSPARGPTQVLPQVSTPTAAPAFDPVCHLACGGRWRGRTGRPRPRLARVGRGDDDAGLSDGACRGAGSLSNVSANLNREGKYIDQ